jgi:hypothetical protein
MMKEEPMALNMKLTYVRYVKKTPGDSVPIIEKSEITMPDKDDAKDTILDIEDSLEIEDEAEAVSPKWMPAVDVSYGRGDDQMNSTRLIEDSVPEEPADSEPLQSSFIDSGLSESPKSDGPTANPRFDTPRVMALGGNLDAIDLDKDSEPAENDSSGMEEILPPADHDTETLEIGPDMALLSDAPLKPLLLEPELSDKNKESVSDPNAETLVGAADDPDFLSDAPLKPLLPEPELSDKNKEPVSDPNAETFVGAVDDADILSDAPLKPLLPEPELSDKSKEPVFDPNAETFVGAADDPDFLSQQTLQPISEHEEDVLSDPNARTLLGTMEDIEQEAVDSQADKDTFTDIEIPLINDQEHPQAGDPSFFDIDTNLILETQIALEALNLQEESEIETRIKEHPALLDTPSDDDREEDTMKVLKPEKIKDAVDDEEDEIVELGAETLVMPPPYSKPKPEDDEPVIDLGEDTMLLLPDRADDDDAVIDLEAAAVVPDGLDDFESRVDQADKTMLVSELDQLEDNDTDVVNMQTILLTPKAPGVSNLETVVNSPDEDDDDAGSDQTIVSPINEQERTAFDMIEELGPLENEKDDDPLKLLDELEGGNKTEEEDLLSLLDADEPVISGILDEEPQIPAKRPQKPVPPKAAALEPKKTRPVSREPGSYESAERISLDIAISPEQIEAALERVVDRIFSNRIEKIVRKAVEEIVADEVKKLGGFLGDIQELPDDGSV